MPSATTSIRLPKELSQELAKRARATKRGKNWIIKEALELYLLGSSQEVLKEESRRQSLLASKRTPADGAWAEQDGDVEEWQA